MKEIKKLKELNSKALAEPMPPEKNNSKISWGEDKSPVKINSPDKVKQFKNKKPGTPPPKLSYEEELVMSANCDVSSSSSNHNIESCLTPKRPEYKSPMAKASSYQPSPAASHSLLRNAQRGLQNSSS